MASNENTMKRLFGLINTILVCCVFAVSCITDEPEPESSLAFAESGIDAPARAKEVISLQVNSNTRWRVDTLRLDTLKVLNYGIISQGSSSERKFGIGSGTLKLTLAENGPDENGEFHERKIDVVIYVNDRYVATTEDRITISQEAGEYWLELTQISDSNTPITSISAVRAGGVYDLRVASNGPWSASYTEGIISTITDTEDNYGEIIQITVPENTTGEARVFRKTFRVEREPYPSVELEINQSE